MTACYSQEKWSLPKLIPCLLAYPGINYSALIPLDHALPLRGQPLGWLTIAYRLSDVFVHVVGWEYTATSFRPEKVSHNTPSTRTRAYQHS